MEYIVCNAPGDLALLHKAVPNFETDQVLLQIKRVGICGTDLHAYQGNQPFFSYPRILGHELSAEVIEVGAEVTHVKTGDRVVILPYVSCGSCIACRAGKTNCCVDLQVLGVHSDGGMQQYIAVSGDLVRSVNDLTHEDIAIVEPLAIGAHAVRRAQVTKGEYAVVVGCGPIGLGIIHFACQAGAKVIAVDKQVSRLTIAQSMLPIDHVVEAGPQAISEISKITNGHLAQKVFDATGNKNAMEFGIEYMSHGGSYILVGIVKDHLSFYDPAIQAKETSILCSRNATWEDFEQVLSSLRKSQFPTDQYITHTVGFHDAVTTFPQWLDPAARVVKAMLHW